MADEARSYQLFSEVVLSGGGGSVRASQLFAEAVLGGNPEVQVSQFLVEAVVDPTAVDFVRAYQVFVEAVVNIEEAEQFIISDKAYATDGFFMDEANRMTVSDFGITATFEVSGTFESAPIPERIVITDNAIATDGFVTETPTLIVLGDVAYATDTFYIRGRITISDNAVASQILQTILNGNPGILAENRYPW